VQFCSKHVLNRLPTDLLARTSSKSHTPMRPFLSALQTKFKDPGGKSSAVTRRGCNLRHALRIRHALDL
jgi:hypothetical protein